MMAVRPARRSWLRIPTHVIWRRDGDQVFVLDPSDKRLLVLGRDAAAALDDGGWFSRCPLTNDTVGVLKRARIADEVTEPPCATTTKTQGPMNVTLRVTDQCNLRCDHCHNDHRGRSTMRLDALEHLAQQLRSLSVFNVNVSGGEPTLHAHAVDAVTTLVAAGLRVTMSTNGTTMTDRLAARLAQAGLRRVQISLDSWEAQRHDAIRGQRGAFRRMREGLAHLRRHGIKYLFVTTLNGDQTATDYERTIDLAHGLGGTGHKTNTVIPQGSAKKCPLPQPQAFQPHIDVWKRRRKALAGRFALLAETMFAFQIGREEDAAVDPPSVFGHGCPAGVFTCAITENGDVNPCSFFGDVVVGNAFEFGFEQVWANSPFRGAGAWMNGCRARAFVASGSVDGCDPLCHADWSAERIQEQRT